METLTQPTVTTVTPKRNRHSVENDQQSALIKRINRLYTKAGSPVERAVRVIDGVPRLIDLRNGEIRPDAFYNGDLKTLETILRDTAKE